jgi:D-alanyl-D-alanine carboxypeptidase
MIERLTPYVFLLAVVLQGPPRARCQSPVDPAFAALLQQKLDSCRNVYAVPGISATLLLPGDRYWNGVSGVADIYTQEPMDTALVFQAASVTKLFTATIIFQLIEEGLLDLDDTVDEYLPSLPNIPGNTRIRYLLNHRSGLADYLSTPGAFDNWFSYPDSIWPPTQIISTYSAPPLFNQNAAFSYSNTNYMLLGMIVESITGNPFHEELYARLLVPLDLAPAYFPPAVPVSGDLVPGWSSFQFTNTYDTDVTPILRDCFASFGYAAGSLVTTPNVLARFTRALMRGTLLTPASMATMRTCSNIGFSDGANGYGHGTMRYVYAGRTYFGHSGDISGFTQMSVHSEQDSVTITLSINRNNAPRGPIAAAMLATVHQGLTVGIMDPAHQQIEFELFPVPASEHVTIRAVHLRANDQIEMLDAMGRVVHIEQASTQGTHTLGLRGLTPGQYVIRWHSSQGVARRALLVE